MKILITGGAGFIGAVIAAQLLVRGDTVVVIDNLNDYYEVSLKQARLHHLQHNRSQSRAQSRGNFSFLQTDITDRDAIMICLRATPLMSLSIWQHRQALFNRKPICIDDVVEAMVRVIDKPAQAEPNFDRANPTPANSAARYQIFNIGNGNGYRYKQAHCFAQAIS